jgi:ABC-2 type transport system permease protein
VRDVVNSRILWAVIHRDLRLLLSSKSNVIPIVVVSALIFAGLPLLVGLAPSAINIPLGDVGALAASLPGAGAAGLPADPDARLTVLLLVYLLAPMFLIVPIMLSIVAAAGAIAGERERGTLETLLLSPISDRQLFVAKTAGAWIPAVLITVVGAVVYQVVATVVLAGTGAQPFPNLLWTLLVLWVSPAVAAAALGALVMVSARARTFQDAMQFGGVLVLPVVAVTVAQSTGLLALGVVHVAVAGAALWVAAGLLLRAGARTLRRDQLTPRL